MKNNKGFTLVELLATLVVLAIVMSIGAYSIINIVKSSKEEEYNVLMQNITEAAKTYFNECKYMKNGGVDDFCFTEDDEDEYDNFYWIDKRLKLKDLVKYGYLNGNSKNSDYVLVNPKNKESMDDCSIGIEYTIDKTNQTKELYIFFETRQSNKVCTGTANGFMKLYDETY